MGWVHPTPAGGGAQSLPLSPAAGSYPGEAVEQRSETTHR